MPEPIDVERAVRERYSRAAEAAEPALCCAVEYDAALLDAIPPEILERDYGCGDPSRHLRGGEDVLDLGSGGGKLCYIAAQIVGARGSALSTWIYLAMGWLALIAIKPIWEQVPRVGLVWMLAGGLAYTIGVLFYVARGRPYAHFVWHLFVLAGSACHFVAVLRYSA